MSFDTDESICEELYIFIKSTGKLYAQRQAIERALAKKYKTGKFDAKKAPAAFKYLVDAGAKAYDAEHGDGGRKMPGYFPAVVRRAVAERFAEEFVVEAKLGNFI